MCKCLLSFFLACILLIPAMSFAQDTGVPDTVYFGDSGKAYGYPGGHFKIPVILAVDEPIVALILGIEYGIGGVEPTFDSAGTFGAIMADPSYLDLTGLVVNTTNINGALPDSVMIGGVGLSGHELPPGRYTFCNLWFSGGNVGEQVMVDSAYTPTAGTIEMVSLGGDGFTPRFVGGMLTIETGPPEIVTYLPSNISGDAATTISFEASANASYPPVTISLDSLVNAATGLPPVSIPSASGSNPLLFEWLPTYEEYGSWIAWFTACDASSNCVEFPAYITVNWVEPPSDVMRGDSDCNNVVNISDVVYLLNYIFGQGPPPGCGEK